MDMKINNSELKKLRESKAWSQTQLAEVSGISLRTIQRIEKSGIASPESLKSLCAAFDIQISKLSQPNKEENPLQLTFPNIKRINLSKLNKKATLVSFITAFVISYLLTIWM